MAIESVTADAGSGGASFAVDTITGDVQVPYAKLMSGADASETLIAAGGGVEANALRVTIASDSTGVVSVDDNGASLTVDNAGLTALASAISTEVQCDIVGALPAGDNNIGNVDIASIAAGDNNIGNVDIASALPAGTNAIGKLAANSGVDIGDVDVTSISAGTNLIGDVGIQGRATGGLSIFKSIDLDESEEEVKATAGTVYSILAFNTTAAPLYLKFYNLTAANTTVGTSTPVITLVVPGNADSDGAGLTHSVAQGYAFDTAISVAVTTGVADNDTGAPGANACIVLIGYK